MPVLSRELNSNVVLFMKILRNISLVIGSILVISCSCEKNIPNEVEDANPAYRFMFYNVENLFDTIGTPGTPDNEYIPDGEKEWDTRKYYDKLNNIAKVAKGIGGEEYPALIGLC